MSTGKAATSPLIRDRLAGQHILVTGSTGFLAKAFVEKLLRSVDSIAGIYLLVRSKPGVMTPEQRVGRYVLGCRAFDRLRATLGDRFEKLCEEKIHVVGGDLTRERFGLDRKSYDELAERITLVVNSAATVTFDERLDLAVDLNSLGPTRLLNFARDCGSVPFLHVSTCYVCGARSGEIVEDFSAPEPARESLPRGQDGGGFDLDELVNSLRAEAVELRTRFGADTEACRRELIEAGMRRARSYGWNDTYTFTKWLGEQLLIRDCGDVPLAIFRPAIIEGSFEEPLPGWIDGLRMADPIIVAYGRGKLIEFPADPTMALDLIPVDFVANAMVATLAVGMDGDRPVVYHCASSGRNPLHLRTLMTSLERAFLKRPMNGEDGRPIHPRSLRVARVDAFTRRWQRRRRWVVQLRKLLESFHFARKQVRKLAALSRKMDQLIYFAKIYSPYTHLDCRFADDALRSVAAKLHDDDKAEFPFDVERMDWDDYIVNRHVPGVRSFVLGTGAEPSGRIAALEALGGPGPSVEGDALTEVTLFEAFEHSARRFPDKPALQIRREGRWIRYTYDEALHATGTIMRRFQERGISAGDRIAICADSGPEWGLVYLGVMRAGMTAVPLDPRLPPADAWAAARFANAKLMCAGTTTFEGLARADGANDADLVTMSQPFVPPPGASRDPTPDPVSVPGTAVASILFTSGTTVAPRAVQLTHRNFLANAAALLQVHPVYPADEFLSVLPMYHAFEFTGGFLVPIVCGGTITYVEQLKGPDIRAAMQATGTTVMLAVPRLLRMFHDAIVSHVSAAGITKRSLFRLLSPASKVTGGRCGRTLFRAVHKQFGGRLRMMVSGGSRLDPDLFDLFAKMGFSVFEGYGLTETSPVLTVSPPGDSRAGSVGPALPNVELDIRNQNLEGIGEVWVRGPSVMSGYLNNPEATERIIVDRWLRTGDLGRLDAGGHLYLTGRSTDLIVTGAGKNVYPDEVEHRYCDLPYVRELCVFGVPSDDGLGDTVHAVIVIDADAAPDLDRSSIEREIRMALESISETIPPHQRIAVQHFWDRELPKTSTLKAKRGVIRKLVCVEAAGRDGADAMQAGGAAPDERSRASGEVDEESPASVAIREILTRQSRLLPDAILPHMHLLLDLGIDSIGKIDVLGEIETQFGMKIGDEKAAKIARVSDLISLVGDKLPVKGRSRDRGMWQRKLAGDGAPVNANGKLPPPLVPIRWLVRGGVGLFMNTYVRVRVRGRSNIPARGPFILAPNHSSHLDSPSTLMAVSGRRRVWVAGAEDYFFNSRLKRFIFGKILDTISFDRQADGLRGLRRCGEALRLGDGLLIFPEGTRSTTGEIQPFKIGAAVLAIEQKVPIVPVHIHRTFNLLRKGQRFVRPGRVDVTFGSPIDPPNPDECGDHYEAFRALTERVEKAVIALRDEAQA